MGSAERSRRKDLMANPLIVGDEKIVPNITHVSAAARICTSAFDVYDALRRSGEHEGAAGEGGHELVYVGRRKGVSKWVRIDRTELASRGRKRFRCNCRSR